MFYRRILITGANGLLGQALVKELSSRPEYDVLATGKDSHPRYTDGSCGYTSLDITKPEEIRRLFLDFSPEVVINTAAKTNVDDCEKDRSECWEINVTGTENLVRACRTAGSRIVQVSTDFVFNGSDGPYREADRPEPVNYYGRSKLAAENAVRSLRDDRWSIARTCLVFGSGIDLTRSNFALWVIEQLRAGKSLHIVTDQFRTPTYAPDLAAGIEQIVRYGKNGVFHLSGSEFLQVYEIARTIARTLGLDESLVSPTDSSNFTQTAQRPLTTGFIILKAETELGYRPTPLPDAIRELAHNCGYPVPTTG